ncbi:para-nitrobenzyl esterase [Kitasatospora sp. GAS204A]|uniref:carboxylesterase/lipase family protein n=2 Tax=Kitasatospora TaxID=2063 RepID=UPI002473B39F|nr:carboxylesterase family protein [Kitasatospora sp. GAS204B]MDH6120671.1 para-nitrobenzyl esterase [Kitasatospora sp. GAS204B]
MNSPPVVRMATGQVRGVVEGGCAVFHSIPYAAAPVGAARFAAPGPPPRWDGIRDATRPGPSAPAPARDFGLLDLTPLLGAGPSGGGDYLTVTVSTPGPGGSGLPVIVFVHGGGFISGTGQSELYEGTSFARDGVVLVTLNYRLGVAGWLDLPDAPANRGLLDVIAALRWVAANIHVFGGDPARVTVCGQSAGAVIVASLLACPQADGLFQRAISQSETGECAYEPEQAARVTGAVAQALGTAPTAVALGELTDARLTALIGELPPIDHAAHGFLDTMLGSSPFRPVIDGILLHGQPARTVLAATGTELLIGTTTDEADTYTVPSGVLDTATDVELLAAARRRVADPEQQVAAYRARFPGERPGRLLSRVITDTFTAGSRRLAQAHASRSGGRTFRYEFAWRSQAFAGALGACHCLELPFVFDRLKLPALRGEHALLGTGRAPLELAAEMHGDWVRFATTGEPGWDQDTTHRYCAGDDLGRLHPK